MTITMLKKVLLVDAAVCALTFTAAMLAGARISADLGLAPAYVTAAGWICLGAAALMTFTGTREKPPALLVWLIVFLNIDWVIASVALLGIEAAALTTYGTVVIAGQAVGVLVFILLEAAGARLLGKRTTAAA